MRDRIGLALATCAALACATPGQNECAGGIVDLEQATARRLHVRVLLTRDDEPERHELVLRARPGRVEAIGLTPMGTEAYRLIHGRHGVEVENRVGRYLGLSPRLAYDAVAHGFLAGPGDSGSVSERNVERPGCGYRARIVLVSDEPLTSPAPAEPPPP